ncbi:MAG: thioredoxin [Anaerolineae bacterium]
MDLLKGLFGGKKETSTTDNTATAPRHLTDAEFDALVRESQVPVVVDFWAEWCGPCHAIAPAVANLATEFDGRAVVAKLNADEYPDVLARYGIMGIPTLIYFQAGQEVDRVIGYTSYGVLKSKLERLLK